MSPRSAPARLSAFGLAWLACFGWACSRDRERPKPSEATASAAPLPSAHPPTPLPQLLFLPDGGDIAANNRADPVGLLAPRAPGARCPADMVDVRGTFCIDRYEAVLFDARGHRRLSPHYHPTRAQTRVDYDKWRKVPAVSANAPEVPSFAPSRSEVCE